MAGKRGNRSGSGPVASAHLVDRGGEGGVRLHAGRRHREVEGGVQLLHVRRARDHLGVLDLEPGVVGVAQRQHRPQLAGGKAHAGGDVHAGEQRPPLDEGSVAHGRGDDLLPLTQLHEHALGRLDQTDLDVARPRPRRSDRRRRGPALWRGHAWRGHHRRRHRRRRHRRRRHHRRRGHARWGRGRLHAGRRRGRPRVAHPGRRAAGRAGVHGIATLGSNQQDKRAARVGGGELCLPEPTAGGLGPSEGPKYSRRN